MLELCSGKPPSETSEKLLSAVTVTKGDGPDANHQTSTSTFITAPRKFEKRLREKTNVTSLIANIIIKDMLSVVYGG